MSLTTTQIPHLEIASDQAYVTSPALRVDSTATLTLSGVLDATGGTFKSFWTTGGSLDSATLALESLSITSVSGNSAVLTWQSSDGSTYHFTNDAAAL